MRKGHPRSFAILAAITLLATLISPISAPALSFTSAPASTWGRIFAAPSSTALATAAQPVANTTGEVKSEWRVNYENFPKDAQGAVQHAIDIWSTYFASKVPITVEASWQEEESNQILGSARPGFYYSGFNGAPDPDLWYPSALANALTGRDLEPDRSEIYLRINSLPLWYTGIDGKPNPRTYDLVSVVIHEIGHGLGFLSGAEYDRFFGTGYIFQPTAYDAYAQLPDGRTLADFCSRSLDLGRALINPLFWSGPMGIAANKGVKPKLYTPNPFIDGSSITHLDEELFSRSPLDSAMTPNLEPGESFNSPGPIALAMIEDMLKKPPVSPAASLPAKPVNFKALLGDKYVILTFDSPNCRRVDRITGYTVTINQTGEQRKFTSSPIRITGLKNSAPYTFTLTAENTRGSSEAVISNTVRPQQSGDSIVIDKSAKVTNLAHGIYRGRNIIVYGDLKKNQVKLATQIGSQWRQEIIEKGVTPGPISLCIDKRKSTEELHLFYGETKGEDLRYSYFNGKTWSRSIVDGNGTDVQDYSEPVRRRTAANVSVSNACAITTDGIQVFYRDETQGILLGAVKANSGWIYEIVDGDKRTNGRTIGDVGFVLSAASLGKRLYLLYDSVLTINAGRMATEGEVRLASRNSIYPEDWRYQTIDGPENGLAVAGYATSLVTSGKKIAAAWLAANGDNLPYPDLVRFAEIDDPILPGSISTSLFGRPSAPLAVDQKGLAFGCFNRICRFSPNSGGIKLTHGANSSAKSGAIVIVNKKRYFVTALKGRLTLIAL
jgi:hypothetical protein